MESIRRGTPVPRLAGVLRVAATSAAALITVVMAVVPAAFSQVTSCAGQPDGTPCSDDNPCTYGEVCWGDACTGGWPITCNSDACATRACNGTSTCTVVSITADGTPCNDGNVCTSGDTCNAGACAGMLVDDGVRVRQLSPGSATSVISWNKPTGATTFDVVRGFISHLPVSPTGVWETPLVQNQTGTVTADGTVPAPGEGYWYLVRARNGCPGAWGFEADHVRAALPEISNGGCVANAGASPRFVDNGLTVTDRTTCLEWEKKSSAQGVNDVNDFDGSAFLPTLDAGRFARHNDWRRPSEDGCPASSTRCPCITPHELESILNQACVGGIDPIFGPTALGYYASSTVVTDPFIGEWVVSFGTGSVSFIIGGGSFHVRAVRGP